MGSLNRSEKKLIFNLPLLQTKYILGSQNYHRASNGVEKLPFYNHTECHCVDRLEEVMPRDGGPTTDYRLERTVEPG